MGPPSALQSWVGGPHYDKQICSGEMGENKKQNDLCTVERCRKDEIKMASVDGAAGCIPATWLLAAWLAYAPK